MTDTHHHAVRKFVDLLADLRTLMAVALYVLVWHLFDLIAETPKLTDNQGFMFLAQSVIATAFVGGVFGFLFVASKTMADARKETPPAAGTVTATMTATAETEKPE